MTSVVDGVDGESGSSDLGDEDSFSLAGKRPCPMKMSSCNMLRPAPTTWRYHFQPDLKTLFFQLDTPLQDSAAAGLA